MWKFEKIRGAPVHPSTVSWIRPCVLRWRHERRGVAGAQVVGELWIAAAAAARRLPFLALARAVGVPAARRAEARQDVARRGRRRRGPARVRADLQARRPPPEDAAPPSRRRRGGLLLPFLVTYQ